MKKSDNLRILKIMVFAVFAILFSTSVFSFVCPPGTRPAPTGVVGPVAAITAPSGVSSSSAPGNAEPSTILSIAQRYEGRAYGTGSTEFTDTAFIEQVFRDLGIPVSASMHNQIAMVTLTAPSGISPSFNDRHRGVVHAIIDGALGEQVQLANVRAGDFVQYWWLDGSTWKRRAAIIKQVKQDGKFDLYGPYATDNAVSTYTDVELSGTGKQAYFGRLNSQAIASLSRSNPSSTPSASPSPSPSSPSASTTPAANPSSQQSGCGTKVALVGDSLTACGGGYITYLRDLCGSSTTIMNDDGNSGSVCTSAQPNKFCLQSGETGDPFAYVCKRTSQMKNDFSAVLDWNPDTIVLLGGTNDLGGSWTSARDNLRDMYSLAKTRGIRIVAVTVPPLKTEASRPAGTQAKIQSLNDWIMTESLADLKVNIFDDLKAAGTTDINPAYFRSDQTHPNDAGKRIMAQKIHGVLTGAISSPAAPAVAGTPATVTPASVSSPVAIAPSCVPDRVLPSTLYDFLINSSAGLTTIVGIARQNIAIGINKTPRTVSASATCQQIQADLDYDIDFLKQTYGQTQLDVESQLQNVRFEDSDVRVHRLIAPVLGCVARDIENCADANSYDFRTITAYDWQPLESDPSLLKTNSFGIALDINLDTNPNAQDGTLTSDIPSCVVDAFKRYGFKWGGDYNSAKCPAHFEFMANPARIVVQEGISCPAGTTLVTVPSNSPEALTSAVGGVSSAVPATSGATPAARISSSASPSSLIGNSDFVWPIPDTTNHWNKVVSCYGPRTLPYTNPQTGVVTTRGGYHDGIDVSLAAGSPIVSISGGTVHRICRVPDVCRNCNVLQSRRVSSSCHQYLSPCAEPRKPCGGWGNNVVIKHADNLYSHYVHMNTIADGIDRGATVTKGQSVGTVGNTGVSQGRHLHFAIYNEWPKPRNTGNPEYPEGGKNPFCFFPDSILSRIEVLRNNCPAMYGSTGQVVSTTHTRLAQDCAQADLSALAGLTPTNPNSVPSAAPAGQPAMVQICRPSSTATSSGPIAAGMADASSQQCRYCQAGKDILRTIDQNAYNTCRSSSAKCCLGPCPSGTVMKQNVELISQCDPRDMGAGGNCWHDGSPPERRTGSNSGESYCSSACAVATTRMGLKSFNLDRPSQELFCGGTNTVYRPGGGRTTLIAQVSKNLGLQNSEYHRGIDWNNMVSSIRSGKTIALLINDESPGRGPTERAFSSGGHFIFLYGASDNYVISNDPGRNNPNSAEKIVLSKSYVERAGREYAVIG